MWVRANEYLQRISNNTKWSHNAVQCKTDLVTQRSTTQHNDPSPPRIPRRLESTLVSTLQGIAIYILCMFTGNQTI